MYVNPLSWSMVCIPIWWTAIDARRRSILPARPTYVFIWLAGPFPTWDAQAAIAPRESPICLLHYCMLINLIWHQVPSKNAYYKWFILIDGALRPVRPTNRRNTSSPTCPLSSTGCEVKYVLFTVVSHTLFLPVCSVSFAKLPGLNTCYSFPLEIVFRIFDNCLASGIESIFGFALSLLQKNEAKLLSLKFDELVAFLNTGIIDTYKVR